MARQEKLKEMLIGYAAAHQHPFNIAVHLIGIPIIMLGAFVPLAWLSIDLAGININGAYVAAVGLFIFYLNLDAIFATVFLALGIATAEAAMLVAALEQKHAIIVATAAFFGGYLLQFIGHAVEKSMPVLVRHPVQANLAAPFFIVVEIFGLLGLRRALFDEIRALVSTRRQREQQPL